MGEPQRGAPAVPPDAPLAVRIRPRSLDEVIGQEHVLGPGSALRTAIESGRPHSAILYGPPGAGETTLARRAAAGERAADDPLPRRDPPLQQGPAGRAAAGGRGRDADADWRHHREPLFRGQL